MEEKRFANVMTRKHFQPGTVSYQTRHAITQIFKNTLKFWVSTKKRFFREKKSLRASVFPFEVFVSSDKPTNLKE